MSGSAASAAASVNLRASLAAMRQRYPPQTHWLAGQPWELIETHGGAQPLLILPGGLAIAETAFRQLEHFGQRFHVLAPTYPASAQRLGDLVAGLSELIQRCQQPVWVVGGSYSGLIAQVLLDTVGPQISQVVLSDTGVPQRWRGQLASAGLPLLRALPQPLLTRLIWWSTRPALRRIQGARAFWLEYFQSRSQAITRTECLSHLAIWRDFDRWQPGNAAWAGRMLLIIAGADELFGPRQQLQLLRRYPQATVRTFAAAAHCASLDLIDAYIACIDAFLCREPVCSV